MLGMRQDNKEVELSKQVAAACVSDPLNEETPLINAPKAATVVSIDAPPADITTGVAANAAATETVATSQ